MNGEDFKIYKGRYKLVATNPYTGSREVFDFEIGDFIPESDDILTTSIAQIDKFTAPFTSANSFLSYFGKASGEREELAWNLSIEYKSRDGILKSLDPIWNDRELAEILEPAQGGSLNLKNIKAYNRYYEMTKALRSSIELRDMLLETKDMTILLNQHSKEGVKKIASLSFFASDLRLGLLFNYFTRYREYRALHIACRRYEEKRRLQKENQGKKLVKSL